MKILLTGSTGFLGHGFLHYVTYKNEVKNIYYLLIRDKKGSKALERLNELRMKFPKLHLELLQISLLEIGNHSLDIDCIINCAASIEFTLPLQDALQQNVDGVKQLILFANKNNVKRFIHISTAYVSSPCQDTIKEEIIDLTVFGCDVNILYTKIKNNEITFNEIVKIKHFPNTYTFTKCLAEKMIEIEIGKLRQTNKNNIIYTIVRPSIVTSAISVPYHGWFQGYAAALGLHSLSQSQYLNYYICNENSSYNIVPIDYVCHIMYYSLFDEKHIIKHASSFFEFIDMTKQSVILNNTYNLNLFLEKTNTIHTKISLFKSLFKIRFQILICYFLSFFDNSYMKMVKKLSSLYTIVKNANNDFYYFFSNTYNFETSNTTENRFPLPEYCDTMEKYYVSMINTLRISLNIHDDCLQYSFFQIIYNIWTKYKCSVYLLYYSFVCCIVKIFLQTIFKQITVEYKSSNTVGNIFHSHKPIMILSNHQSHVDTVILKYLFLIHPNIKIEIPSVIATDEFTSIPSFLKCLLDLTKIHYISKTNFDKKEYQQYLQKDFQGNIMFYPEGTRSRDRQIHTFKSGLYDLTTQKIDCNVLPISISYSKVPETEIFIQSLLNNKKVSFYNTFNLLYQIMSHLFSTPKEYCHIVIDDLIQPPKEIKCIEEKISKNHHYLLNKYHKNVGLNNDKNDLVHYYFNNIQYSKYDVDIDKDIRQFTEFQKYIVGSPSININFQIPQIHKVSIKYQKIFYPIYKDFISIYYKLGVPLILGEYSKELYNKMSQDNNKLQFFLDDMKNNTVFNTTEKYNLIIGVTGLIGSNFFNNIINLSTTNTTTQQTPKKYIILSRNVENNKIIKYSDDKSIEFHLIKGDITSLETIEDYEYKLYNVEKIYHFGGMVTHSKDEKLISQMNKTNVDGTMNVGKIAEINKKIHGNCLMVYLSTSGVISCQDNIPIEKIDENIEYSKNTEKFPYYKSKIDAEKCIITHAKQNDYQLLIFRPSMIFGKQNIELLDSILGIKNINIKHDLFYKIEHKKMLFCTDTFVNAIHVNDLIQVINRAVQKSTENIDIYNLTGIDYVLKDIFKYYNNNQYIFINKTMIRYLIGITDKLNIYPSLYYYIRMCVHNWNIHSEKAKKELGFCPENIFDEKNKNFINIPFVGNMYHE
jgi:1-acyl-sn-glycerol-3-phosphate acyltransferase